MKQEQLFNIKGHIAFVTGAASGLGLAYAEVMAENGAQVVLTRDPDGGWRIEGGVLGVPALVEPRDAVVALRSALARRLGPSCA